MTATDPGIVLLTALTFRCHRTGNRSIATARGPLFDAIEQSRRSMPVRERWRLRIAPRPRRVRPSAAELFDVIEDLRGWGAGGGSVGGSERREADHGGASHRVGRPDHAGDPCLDRRRYFPSGPRPRCVVAPPGRWLGDRGSGDRLRGCCCSELACKDGIRAHHLHDGTGIG